jgi:hypothetical protein
MRADQPVGVRRGRARNPATPRRQNDHLHLFLRRSVATLARSGIIVEKIRRAKPLEKKAFRELGRPLYAHNGKQYDYFLTVGMIFAFSGPKSG